MSNDANDLSPLVRVVTPELPVLQNDLSHASEAQLAMPTAEQVRAADSAFAQHKQRDTVTDLLGLYSSALVLHDLAVEAFQVDDEEEKKKETEPSL